MQARAYSVGSVAAFRRARSMALTPLRTFRKHGISICHIWVDQNDTVIPLNELTVGKAKGYCRYGFSDQKKLKDTACNELIRTNLKKEQQR
jgi:hypothetical protein